MGGVIRGGCRRASRPAGFVVPGARQTTMFQDVLVVTDRHDAAEETVRHRTARERRFLARLKGIALELAFPTGEPAYASGTRTGDIEVQSTHATRHAIDLASYHGARLHVLFLVDAVRYDTTVEFATEPLVEEGEEAIERLVDVAERAGVDVTATVEVGRPAALVADYAGAHGVDVIVLNARDTGGFQFRLREDLVSAVIRRVSTPVYVVPPVQPGHPD